MIVLGTAGHIDHGKSAVVKRLTGTDPDRLPEEKSRGLTIDLGFAFLKTPSGHDIAFVDVPGHERFVKNMIAGAGGIDAVMLVVAADDGWMPQSQEHFDIVQLLGVRHGFTVINKVDLVQPDWLELLATEVREKMAGSFLAESPIYKVSATTGQGFPELEAYLNRFPDAVSDRQYTGKTRLYIDRSFIRPGMGGVVTGTLDGGELTVGQNVTVWPSRSTARVRTLQTRGEDVQTTFPGQRTAVSFTGLDKSKLVRGGVISNESDLAFFVDHPVLALQVRLLPNSPITLANDRQVTLLTGTSETTGTIRLFGATEIKPGGQGCVLFRSRRPLYTLIGDNYIMRLPTPMVTLGGGRVIDHLRRFPRKKELPELGYLNERLAAGPLPLIISELHKRCLVREDALFAHADFGAEDLKAGLEVLVASGRIDRHKEFVFLSNLLEERLKKFRASVERELDAKSHLKGLTLDDLVGLTSLDRVASVALVAVMIDRGFLTVIRDKYTLTGRTASLQGEVKKAYDDIMAELNRHRYDPPALPVLAKTGKSHQQAIKYIIEGSEAYKCGSQFLFLTDVWLEIVDFIGERLKTSGSLAITELRERFGFTRKFAIPILEETDRIGLTRREGDTRVKGDRFDQTLADL